MRRVLRFVRGSVQNSPWLVIAVALHVIVAAAVSVVYLRREQKEEPLSVTSIALAKPRAAREPLVQPPEKIERKLVPNAPEEVVSEEEYLRYVPMEDPPERQDRTLDIGDPDSLDDSPPAGGNTGIGVGTGGRSDAPGPSARGGVGRGNNLRGIPGRLPEGKLQATEKAVLEALRWLVRHQAEDGSWSAAGLRERCTGARPCIGADVEVQPFYDEGLTALALLAFLGAGYGHDAEQRITDTVTGLQYTLGDVVLRGLRWLVARQRSDGSFSAERAFMYSEALCAMALSEAYALSHGAGKRAWRRPAQKAVDFLVAAQKRSAEDGRPWGWRYDSRALLEARKQSGEIDDETYLVEIHDADISVTGWAIMALKSARLGRLDVPEEALQGGLRFARHVSLPDGRAGYQAPEHAGKKVPGLRDEFDYHAGTTSALSMLVRTFVAHDLGDPFLEEAARQIVKDLPALSRDGLSVDYYYWYHGSLALEQFDGPDSPRASGVYWDPWRKAMERSLLELQDRSKEKGACSRGGWLVDDRWSHAGRALYNTAINTLTLEVYYRYENAFGVGRRDEQAPAAARADADPARPPAGEEPVTKMVGPLSRAGL